MELFEGEITDAKCSRVNGDDSTTEWQLHVDARYTAIDGHGTWTNNLLGICVPLINEVKKPESYIGGKIRFWVMKPGET